MYQRRAVRPGDEMSVLTVGKSKKPSGGGGGANRPPRRPVDGTEWTTFRIHAEDGDELGDLAKEEGQTIAELYRALLAPIVRERLIERTEAKLRKLQGQ